MSTLAGKIIWITGASSGIGEALAYELSRKGATLILSARREGELARVKEKCVNSPDIKIIPLDLSDTDSLKKAADEAIRSFGRIDMLMNNGGLGQRSLIRDTALDVDRKIMEVNFFGTIALTKFLLPHFISRKQGHFVTVSSLAGKLGTPYRSAYAAAKHALHGFFDSLRAEHFRDNIVVTMICPGFILTNLSALALTGDGTSQGNLDKTAYRKRSPEWCAKRIVKAIEENKEEVYIGGKEVLSVYLKRLFPTIFSKIIRRVPVR